MINALARLAFRASWGGSSTSVLRAGLVSLASGAALLLVLGSLSSLAMLDRTLDRALDRAFVPTVDEPPDFYRHAIYDATPDDGEQIYVYWWQIDESSVEVPGVPAPMIGQWYVSPALSHRMDASDILQDRFADAEVIHPDGVAKVDELIAYRFVGTDVRLEEGYSRQVAAEHYLGDTTDLHASSVIRWGLLLLGIPAIGLLLAGLGPSAPDLDRRLGLLRVLGATPARLRVLTVFQAVISALPGLGLAAVAWLIVAPRLTTVPVVGRPVAAGDLALAAGQVCLAVLGVLVVLSVCTCARPTKTAAGRPSMTRSPSSRRRRLVPVVVGAAMMVIGSGVFGEESGRTFVAGLIAVSVGGVLALPLVFTHVGDSLTASDGVLPLLIGRRLRWNAVTTARSLIILGVIASLAPVAASWIDLNRTRVQDLAVDADDAVRPVVFHGPLDADELTDLLSQTDAIPVTVAVNTSVEPTITSDSPTFLIADCERLAELVNMERCTPDGAFTVAAGHEGALEAFVTFDEHGARPLVGMATPPAGTEIMATALVGPDWARTDALARAHLVNRPQPGPPLGYVFNPPREAPVVAWILGGLALALVTSGIALGLHLATQSAMLAGSRTRLRALGAESRTIRRLAGLEAWFSITVAGLVALGLGVAASWLFVQMNPDAAMPRSALGLTGLGILAAAALAAGASYVATSRLDLLARGD